MEELFRELSDQEVKEFKDWARENYKPNDPIKLLWHPVICKECEKINTEQTLRDRI